MFITECPRDAMQGIHQFIPTELKIDYLNALLKVGFDTLDFGSFVSPKAIPQLADTSKIVSKLDLSNSKTKLLAIIANERGASDAVEFDEISFLGYPFSISETFQIRNTNATIDESWKRLDKIQNLAKSKNKELLVYLSMGFGNPYGDLWNPELVAQFVERFKAMGIKYLALADTVGLANPIDIQSIFSHLIPAFPGIKFNAHLHATPFNWKEKAEAAIDGGCDSFDLAIKGYGGCPMAADDLTGNLATENLLALLQSRKIHYDYDKAAFQNAMQLSSEVFSYT